MDYSDMKATKTSKADSAKEALDALTSGLSKSKSSTTRKPRSSSSKSAGSTKTKSSGTKSTKSSSTKSNSSKTGTTRSRKTSSASSGTSSRSSSKSTHNVLDIEPIISLSNDAKKISKKTKKAKSTVNKAKKNLILVFSLIFLIVGIASGFLITHFAFANDTYAMVCYANGEADIVIEQGEESTYTYYKELGVKCIAFGKDLSSNFKVTYYYRNSLTEDEIEVDKVDETIEGIYYAVYTSPSKKYSTVKLIRNIIVLRGEDDA